MREKALGEEVLKSLTPGQQVVKVVHDELTQLMGEGEPGSRSASSDRHPARRPPGLGQDDDRREARAAPAQPGPQARLIAADLQRPAAIDQLEQLGTQIQVPVFRTDTKDAVEAARSGLARARDEGPTP